MGTLDQKTPLFRFADTLGNGLGVKSAVGNYAAVDTPFFIETTDPTQRLIIHRVMCYIEDSNVSAPTLATYGGETALTDGVIIQVVRRNGLIIDLTDGLAIQSNSEWAQICYDVLIDTFPAGNNYVHARWTFAKSGWPIILNAFDQLQFVMRDDMTAFIKHSFLLQGYIE